MPLPDYRGGSILNLMSSIGRALGKRSMHPPLRILPSSCIKAKNVVLLVLDGLGYDFLRKYGQNTMLFKHLKGSMTSVFLSSTAPAVSTFYTGVAPQQHGILSWYLYFRELGIVSMPLPFKPRVGGEAFGPVAAKALFYRKPFANGLKAVPFMVMPDSIIQSDFTLAHRGRSRMIAFKKLSGLFLGIRYAIDSTPKRTYVYGYWPGIDSLSHKHGPHDRRVRKHLMQIDRQFSRFLKFIQGTDTLLIVTADHGQIPTPPAKCIRLADHPVLRSCLVLPLSGEPRVAFCYVHPHMVGTFKAYVRMRLQRYCTLLAGKDLIKKGWFGPGKAHPMLAQRVGHFVLLMKEDHTIQDSVIGHAHSPYKGFHGGLTREEMMVPLIIVDCKGARSF